MALVADYEISDEEMEDSEASGGVVLLQQEKGNPPAETEPSSSSSSSANIRSRVVPFFEDSEEEDEGDGGRPVLEKFLPKPKVAGDLEEEEEVGPIPPKKLYGDEEEKPPPVQTFHNLSVKRVKGQMKIAAPSLKDFENDEEESNSSSRFRQASQKGSGLFAILPQPRGFREEKPYSFLKTSSTPTSAAAGSSTTTDKTSTTTTGNGPVMPKSLIPDSVKNAGKRPAQSKLDEIRAKYLKKDANVRIVSRSGKKNETKAADSDDSDEESADFFSFESGINDVDEETLEKLKLPLPEFTEFAPPTSSAYTQEDAEMEDTSQAYVSRAPAHQEDFMKYVQPKKGKGKTEINFIDVSADELRSDNTEWVKNITDESALPARRAKGVGGILKRKHQITYLAVEAKAREQELQQQWAQNRQNKRQTKMKYGF